MNKIEKKKTDLKDQQRSNYHKQLNVNLREGSSSVQKRRRQISQIFTNSSTSKNSKSSYETISNSSRSKTPKQWNKRSRSNTPLKSVKQRRPTPILQPKNKGPPIKRGPQPCKFWMEGRCNKFEQCERRHYQTSQILYKQDKMENNIKKINQEQINNQKILVKIEQSYLITMAELVELTQRDNKALSMAIKISYKNKKALNKLKNALNKNQKDSYTTNEQKNAKQREILIEQLKNTQIDNKNQNALNIIKKKEQIKKQQQERQQILSNKPKITLIKESEEKQVQNQQRNQNQLQQGEIIESDYKSEEEIDMTEHNQINQKKHQQQENIPQSQYQLKKNNTSQINEFLTQNKTNNLNPQTQQQHNKQVSQTQLDKNQEEQYFSKQIPQTLMSTTYIQEKDKQNDNKNKFTQNQISQVFGSEMQKDMQWSKNIKSNFMKWKQTRDEKDQCNVNPSSQEPTKQSQLNSIEQQETIEQSQLKMLYDWKKIYKSKAYRNDNLQSFINQNHPKLDLYDIYKVFNLATNYINSNAFTEEYKQSAKNIEETLQNKEVIGILNIYYNKQFLDKSIEEYTEMELSEQFYKAIDDHQQNQIYKMAEVIHRYLQKLIQDTWKVEIKNPTQIEKQYNKLIIEALRYIIIDNNTSDSRMYYDTTKGTILITFFNYQAIDWQKDIEKHQEK